MPKLKAKREGTLVCLPKYVNAEMLLLEFFRDVGVAIMPVGAVPIDGHTHHGVIVHHQVEVLDKLINYINANIPND